MTKYTNPRPLNTRIIEFTYFNEDVPELKTQDEVDEWHRAIGRLVSRGMGNQLNMDGVDRDALELVGISTMAGGEMVAVYHPVIPTTDVTDENGWPVHYKGISAEVNAVLRKADDKAIEQGTPFVLGAVRENVTGKYGFHS